MNSEYFDGEHFEGFGDKWNAIFENFEEFFCSKFVKVIEDGTPYIEHKNFWALTDKKDAQMSITTLIEKKKNSNEVISFFPMMKGITTEVTLKDKYEWKTKIEGEFACEIPVENINTINFFDGHYCVDIDKFKKNKKVNVSFSGLAFLLDKFEEKEFEIDKGGFYEFRLKEFLDENPDKTENDFEKPIIKLSGEQFRMFMPTEYTCEYEAVGKIEDVNYQDFYGEKIAILKVNFSHTEDDENFYCNIYASQNVLKGYEPQVNDAISTIFWLTGQFEE